MTDAAELYKLYALLNAVSQTVVFVVTLGASISTRRIEFAVICAAAGVGCFFLRFPLPSTFGHVFALVSSLIYLWFFHRSQSCLIRMVDVLCVAGTFAG